MRSTFGGIEIAKRALFAEQAALQTTGHNIANANTRGYTRQVVNLIAARPLEASGLQRTTIPGQNGQSVEFDKINRIREKFLDDQYYNENKSYGEWEVRKDTLEKLETIVNEPTDTGVRQVMQKFWNAWQELSKTPDNLTARAIVKESALALADSFNHTARQLNELTTDLTDNINVKVSGVNTALDLIAGLNRNINRIEVMGNDANDLRDQRDVLLDDLSKVINITRVETAEGFTVSMGSLELVSGFTVSTTVDVDSLVAAAGGDLNSGEIYGLIVSRDRYVKDYRDQLDTMARSLVQGDVKIQLPAGSVIPEGLTVDGVTYTGTAAARTLTTSREVTVQGLNGLHQLGYVLASDGTATAGGEFFVAGSGGGSTITAGNIALNANIVSDVGKIAASMRTYLDPATNQEKVVNGNNDLALAMTALRLTKFNFESQTGTDMTPSVMKEGSLDDFLRAVVGQLGVQSNEAIRQATNQKTLVDQVEARRQSVSGVSLDEEMANMIKYQHAYNAAARAMTTYDEMLDKIINSMGVVGR